MVARKQSLNAIELNNIMVITFVEITNLLSILFCHVFIIISVYFLFIVMFVYLAAEKTEQRLREETFLKAAFEGNEPSLTEMVKLTNYVIF